jgi:hypothetical protein
MPAVNVIASVFGVVFRSGIGAAARELMDQLDSTPFCRLDGCRGTVAAGTGEPPGWK